MGERFGAGSAPSPSVNGTFGRIFSLNITWNDPTAPVDEGTAELYIEAAEELLVEAP